MRRDAVRGAVVLVALFLYGAVYGADPEPAGAPDAAPARARILGRVFERGSITVLPDVTVQGPGGVTALTDAEGRFSLDVTAGDVELVLSEPRYETLKITEHLRAGEGVSVEYRMRLLPRHLQRYRAVVRGEARHEGERFTLRDEELRTQAGTLGDPFRVVGLLPGVATPLPLLPIYVIRGASPGMNGFFLDGMRVPQLFHMLVGGGVVHARLVDRLDFYPGAYDASLGRFSGGVIDAETRGSRPNGQHGEVELRLYDASAALEFNAPREVRITVSGHYGYPGPIIHAVDDRVDVAYWDYQLRLDWKGLTVEALGSYDDVTIARERITRGKVERIPDNFRLMFHRLQIRERYKKGRLELEGAIVGGIDEMQIFGGSGVRKYSLAARGSAKIRWKRASLAIGVDTELSRFGAENFVTDTSGASPDQLGDLGDGRDGVVASGYVSGQVDLVPRRLSATLGGRADVYHANGVTLLGLDPRLQVRAVLMKQLALHVGTGLYQQPPSFPVALPGLDTFALQLGLQRAVHFSSGLEAELPKNVTVSATGYYQKFYNANDTVIDFGPYVCTSPPPESLSGASAVILRQVDGQSYGMELLVRRHKGMFTGWIAYTLSRSERNFSCGLRPADYDQTHILNIVGQVRLPRAFMLSARLYVATGRPVTTLEPPDGRSTIRNNTRLPAYGQLDLRVDREWIFKKWALSVAIELVNVTYSEVVFGLQYPEIDGVVRYDMPSVNGFRWILPSLNLRGRY